MKKKKKSKILIIAAHPDDEVLGCGGTIANLAKEGQSIYCLFLGRGKASRYSGKTSRVKKEQKVLEKEAKKSAKILGISKIFFENFPDQQYDTIPFINLVKAIEKIKEEIKPEIIFTHHSGDLNLDHQIVFRTVVTASRPLENEPVRKIYSFETSSSSEWGKEAFSPNVFVDIKKTFEKKLKALKAYRSELREFPHPRSLKSVENLAKIRGAEAGIELAEAFELIREID